MGCINTEAKSGSPQLIFKDGTSSYGQLQSLSLDNENVRLTTPVRTNNYRDGISYDARTGQIYWASKGSIYRQRSDGTGPEIVVDSTSKDCVYFKADASLFSTNAGQPSAVS